MSILQNHSATNKLPFFTLFGEDTSVVDSFINAVADGAYDVAERYLSKVIRLSCTLDYGKLKNIFSIADSYTRLSAVRFVKLPNNIRTSSILFSGESKSIVHLYTTFEPDKSGDWKICGIERE